ncbi:hypothetical protein AWR36_010605 [Microbulbifer flavimaris]|uniref:Peptidase M1 membrane alanine aminopeptidase domain-containing protein n=1 Tax=Microbulbifer flavimaris TaxID=1781068 RepID=A0ABX4HYI8_9GAMM|nr:hypothetical protein AVO43_10585 [Microbulbifer sp. ZGT114]PCO05169.1 hypothetical protein AWR36_010605 [Microbulbifer flavimaris]
MIDALENPAAFDWKGNIAFNGGTLRADGMQTAWFPQLYDKDSDKLFYEVTYDLKISCNDCRAIFVNGSHPVLGTQAHLISKDPVEPLLLLGDFSFSEQAGNVLINSPLSPADAERVLTRLTAIKQKMAKLLGWQSDSGLTFLSTTPVSKANAWMWVSIPSIVSVDHDDDLLAGLLSEDLEKRISYSQFAAHELAHVFIGERRQFNSDFGFILSESLAEYLASLVVSDLFAETSMDEITQKKLQRAARSPLHSLREISESGGELNNDTVRYQQAPAIWLLLDKNLSRAVMLNWVERLLTQQTKLTDYAFASEQLRASIGDELLADAILHQYFEGTGYSTNNPSKEMREANATSAKALESR